MSNRFERGIIESVAGTLFAPAALTSWLILLLMVSSPGTVFGQGSNSPEHGDFEADGFGGASFMQSFQFPTAVEGSDVETTRTVGMNYASGYLVGLRIAQNVGDFWAADLEYSFANQPLLFTNLSPDIQSLSLSHSVHHWSYNISYLPRTRAKQFRPYARAGAGVGLFYIAGDSKNDALALGLSLRDSWEFSFNAGGGFKYLVYDQAALTFDVKDQMSGIPSYGLSRSTRVIDGQYQPGISRSGLLHNWQISFGVAVHWND